MRFIRRTDSPVAHPRDVGRDGSGLESPRADVRVVRLDGRARDAAPVLRAARDGQHEVAVADIDIGRGVSAREGVARGIDGVVVDDERVVREELRYCVVRRVVGGEVHCERPRPRADEREES